MPPQPLKRLLHQTWAAMSHFTLAHLALYGSQEGRRACTASMAGGVSSCRALQMAANMYGTAVQVTPEMVDAFFQTVPHGLELPSAAGRVMARL